MSKAHPPELKKYMDKRLSCKYPIMTDTQYFLIDIHFLLLVKLNGSRQINGILRGFDPFMNLVIDEAVEINKRNQQVPIGMVVIRGNAVVLLESLDRI